MKIAMVFDGLGMGGIERVGNHYARLLTEHGHQVDIYNLKTGLTDMEDKFPEAANIKHMAVSDLMMPDYYMLMVKKWSWGKYLYPFVYVASSLMMNFKKLAYRLVDKEASEGYDVAIAFSGHFRDLTFVANNFVKTKKKMCWLHGALAEYLVSSCTYGDLYRKIHNLVVLSKDRQEYAISTNLHLSSLNINQLYNPIPAEKEEPDIKLCEKIRSDYGKYLLMVGRFEADKDQKTVIKAKKILRDKYGKNPKLVFVGGGSTLEECRKYACELGEQEDIIFEGQRFDVQNFYTTAMLNLHSSPAEGLPTVLLEAMKYGLPNVATDSPPGVSEILSNDKYGIRCGVGDAEDMAEKINRMLEDDKLREHYILMGHERLSDFTMETIGGKLETIFESLQ